MPNWSHTSYVMVGNSEQLNDLYNKMSELEQMKEPLVANRFGPNWLGCLVKFLGGDPKKVYCRGHWFDLCFEGDSLTFNCEHAWSRPMEVEDLIQIVYPDIDIYFLEEELGMGIFRTNDSDNAYFNDTVIVDFEDEGMEYYNDAEALDALSEIKGESLSSWEEVEDFVKVHNEKADTDGESSHIWLHRVDYV